MACSHPENRSSLTKMEEWPEWILEVLISNYEVMLSNLVLDLNFLIFPFLKSNSSEKWTFSNGTGFEAVFEF